MDMDLDDDRTSDVPEWLRDIYLRIAGDSPGLDDFRRAEKKIEGQLKRQLEVLKLEGLQKTTAITEELLMHVVDGRSLREWRALLDNPNWSEGERSKWEKIWANLRIDGADVFLMERARRGALNDETVAMLWNRVHGYGTRSGGYVAAFILASMEGLDRIDFLNKIIQGNKNGGSVQGRDQRDGKIALGVVLQACRAWGELSAGEAEAVRRIIVSEGESWADLPVHGINRQASSERGGIEACLHKGIVTGLLLYSSDEEWNEIGASIRLSVLRQVTRDLSDYNSEIRFKVLTRHAAMHESKLVDVPFDARVHSIKYAGKEYTRLVGLWIDGFSQDQIAMVLSQATPAFKGAVLSLLGDLERKRSGVEVGKWSLGSDR